MALVVGIDPGVTGAVAVVHDGELVDVRDLTTVEVGPTRRILDPVSLAAYLETYRPTHGAVEAQHAMGMNGTKANFSMGSSYGICVAALAARGLDVMLVPPRHWQGHWELLGAAKDAARATATTTFPAFADRFRRKMDHNRADASLIAGYCNDALAQRASTTSPTWILSSEILRHGLDN